jgi:hypothetical protein
MGGQSYTLDKLEKENYFQRLEGQRKSGAGGGRFLKLAKLALGTWALTMAIGQISP